MTLQEFKDGLDEFIKQNPECLQMNVYTSIDDEGNGYNGVYYSPSIGIMDDGDFITESMCESKEEWNEYKNQINAVVIN